MHFEKSVLKTLSLRKRNLILFAWRSWSWVSGSDSCLQKSRFIFPHHTLIRRIYSVYGNPAFHNPYFHDCSANSTGIVRLKWNFNKKPPQKWAWKTILTNLTLFVVEPKVIAWIFGLIFLFFYVCELFRLGDKLKEDVKVYSKAIWIVQFLDL